jgi:hypothetical protein
MFTDQLMPSLPFMGACIIQRGVFRKIDAGAAAILGYDDPGAAEPPGL